YPVWGGRMIVTRWELLKSFFLAPLISWNLRRYFRWLLSRYQVKGLYCLSLNEKLYLSPYAVSKGVPVTWVEHQEIRNWLVKSPWRKRYQKNAKQVKIIPISSKNRRQLLEQLHVPSQNIVDIVNGVDVQELASLNRDTHPGLILTVARLIPKKGVMDFLLAVKPLLEQDKGREIIIVGEGPEEPQLKKFVSESIQSDKIRFMSFLKKEKLHDLLAITDVFVIPSRDTSETFSLLAAEAMASGCKVVVTTCSGIADYLHSGKDAFLCLPQRPEDLRRKIELALDAPEDIREEARRTVRAKFNIKDMLTSYQNLILRTHE
ncbi:MAG: glycosyltransferase family 4 protein, partial [bacterium]|nr:glycosyltransferase family 4 protein [bacterium]